MDFDDPFGAGIGLPHDGYDPLAADEQRSAPVDHLYDTPTNQAIEPFIGEWETLEDVLESAIAYLFSLSTTTML